MHCEEISLDEYIRRNNIGDQFTLLNHRKRDRNIDEEALNKSLYEMEDYIRQARAGSSLNSSNENPSKKTGNGKFDRKSMLSDEESDEGEDFLRDTPKKIQEDIEMADESEKKEAEVDFDDLNLGFQTVESKFGVRVRSQQWRLLPENLEDRPEGMKRLEFLPLDENERFRRVQSGRIDRNRSRTSSFSSNFSRRDKGLMQEGIRAQGNFIEKGSFTIKIGDRNGDGEKGVIGIERAKRITPPEVRQEVPPAPAAIPPITINMNWDGFFKGVKSTVEAPKPEPKNVEQKLHIAAANLLQMLREQRDQEVESQYNSPPVIDEIPGTAFVDKQPRTSMYSRFM